MGMGLVRMGLVTYGNGTGNMGLVTWELGLVMHVRMGLE